MRPIRIYTTRWCGYCVRAKTLLDSRKIPYEEVSLDDDPAFRQKLFDLTGGWTARARSARSSRPRPYKAEPSRTMRTRSVSAAPVNGFGRNIPPLATTP